MRSVPVGKVILSPSRRLTACLRTEHGETSPILDLRLQIEDGRGWHSTGAGLRVEVDRLPELLGVLEAALERLPKVSG